MDRAAVTIKKARPRQNEAAGTHRTDPTTMPQPAPQEAFYDSLAEFFRIKARANENQVDVHLTDIAQRSSRNANPAIGCDLATIGGKQDPIIKLPIADEIGTTQRLYDH